jgi:hypothetical protein
LPGACLPEKPEGGKMAEKTEVRPGEYREFENGKWGPWRKQDGGRREDERVELLPCQTNAEMIIDEHITGKIDDWKARKMLNKVLSRIREEINYPAFKTVKDKIEAARAGEIDRINNYLEKIEKKILEAGPLQTITPHSLETEKEPPDIIVELRDGAQKLKLANNGKYDIVGKQFELLKYCAILGWIDDFTFTKDILNRWINHTYKPGSLDKAWRAAVKWAEKMNDKNEEVYKKASIIKGEMERLQKKSPAE